MRDADAPADLPTATPEQRLRAAIERLEQLDRDATPGPWSSDHRGICGNESGYDDVIVGGPVECMSYCYGGTSTLEGDRFEADKALIVALRGCVPEILAILRTGLREAEASVVLGRHGVTSYFGQALALADRVLEGLKP